MTSKPEDGQHVDGLLIGGGVATAGTAEELRRRGFRGSSALAGREGDPPYHRFPLTEDYLRGFIVAHDRAVRLPEWSFENDIQSGCAPRFSA
ncbi:hypothetical protein [Nocardia cerradoensis]|uniref:hypothetical protein n=1 Tax=Nocardia cerradoensis TaxID=85688 RepID=UPI0005855676|nr:hypothetical protein [Nocardia cerradoensis]NKY42498.1 hypothetical protein [Nocardia cerradoensis]